MHGETDVVVLVSADSDLLPPLELIKAEFREIRIRVCFPPSRHSHDITDVLSSWKSKPVIMKNNYRRFENAIMPDNVADGKYSIPQEWKQKQTVKSEKQ